MEQTLTYEAEIAYLKKEVATLERQARDFEAWLLENSESPNWIQVKNHYDDILFRMETKKMRMESIKGRKYLPKTYSYPAFKGIFNA